MSFSENMPATLARLALLLVLLAVPGCATGNFGPLGSHPTFGWANYHLGAVAEQDCLDAPDAWSQGYHPTTWRPLFSESVISVENGGADVIFSEESGAGTNPLPPNARADDQPQLEAPSPPETYSSRQTILPRHRPPAVVRVVGQMAPELLPPPAPCIRPIPTRRGRGFSLRR